MVKTHLHPAFAELRRARDEERPLGPAWQTFCAEVKASVDRPPFLVRDVLNQVEKQRNGRPRGSIRILDHGCGGGFALLYLLARGYTGIFGVDIVHNEGNPMWNRLMAEVLGSSEKHFSYYDGIRLPFDDTTFDVVFSNQVIEHVEGRYWEAFLDEEARVLKPGGIAFHEAPHRLGPYESHSRTWLLHYLPRPMFLPFYAAFGRGGRDTHYLRFPWTIKAALGRKIGPVEDITLVSFLESTTSFSGPGADAFDGPVGVRRAVDWLCRLPILGFVIGSVVGRLAMLRVVARKPETRGLA